MIRCNVKQVLAVAVVLLLVPWPAGAAEPGRGRLEFRRAETDPAKGLVEARVGRSDTRVYLHKEVELTGKDVADATIDEDETPPLLKLTFTREGARKLAKLTKEHRDKPLAVLLDGKVLVAPTIRATLSDRAVLSGFDKADLGRIVKGLNAK